MKMKLRRFFSLMVSITLMVNVLGVAALESDVTISAQESSVELRESSDEPQESSGEPQESSSEPQNSSSEPQESSSEPQESSSEPQNSSSEPQNSSSEPQESSSEPQESSSEPQESSSEPQELPTPPRIVIAGFAPLADGLTRKFVDVGTEFAAIELPATLSARDTNQTEISVGVSWVCDGYIARAALGTVFTARAVLPQEYELAEGVETPSISIILGGSAPRSINDRIIVSGAIYKELGPDSVQLIGYDSTFNGSLVIPEQVTRDDGVVFTVASVAENAFKNCEKVSDITIEGNPTIGKEAFAWCKAAGVNLGSKLDNLGEKAFFGCTALQGVTIPASLKTISQYAFSESGLQSLTFAADATTIGSYMFSGCKSLTDVTIPGSITNIGDHAFELSEVKSVIIESGVTKIGDYVFMKCASLTSVQLPDTLTSIGTCSFSDCTSLESVQLPNSLKNIENSAFANCSALTDIKFSDALTTIGNQSFFRCTALAKIQFPDTLTEIGIQSFYQCTALTSVTLPDTLTEIGSYAFNGCTALTSVELPNTLTTIASNAFAACVALTSVKFPDKLATIGDSAFSGCTALTSVTFPDTLTTVGYSAFSGCAALTSVEFPDALTTIGNYAFQRCGKLNNVTLPNSLKTIGEYAFAYTPELKSITVPGGVTSFNYGFYDSGLESVMVNGSVSDISSGAFMNCKSLQSVQLANGVAAIDSSAFMNCTALKDINIPTSVTTILSPAFHNSGLLSVSIPNSVQYVGSSSFAYSRSLAEVTLDGNDTEIAGYAFSDCPLLATVSITGTVKSIAENAFSGANQALIINVPSADIAVLVRDSGVDPEKIKINGGDSGLAPKNFVSGNANYKVVDTTTGSEKVVLTSIVDKAITSFAVPATVDNSKIQYQVTEIANGAFSGCYNLASVDMADSVLKLGASVFSGCSALTSVKISSKVTSIETQTFLNCTSLRTVSLPNDLTNFGYGAFRGCTALESIKIPAGVTEIAERAFQDCTSLEAIEIPSEVTSIQPYTFLNCSKLAEISIPDAVTSIGSQAFECCVALSSITLPNDLTFISYHAFYGCTSLDNLVIPDKVTTIDHYAFQNCTALSSVSLPDSLQHIFQYAFSGCTALKKIVIPKNVTELAQYAFSGCTELTSAVISGNIYRSSRNSYNYWSYYNDNIFNNCTKLSEVTFSGNTNAQIPYKMFSGCSALKKVTMPGTVTSVGAEAFMGCGELTTVSLSDKLQTIYESAFSGCAKLASVTIPSVTTVGIRAFYGCKALNNITLPDNINLIDSESFVGCADLAWAKIGNGLQTIKQGAFPTTTQLISNDSRVQLLLVEYLHQDARPASEWNGKTDLLPGAIVAVNEDVVVSGNITTGKGSELTIHNSVTITGTLTIKGKVVITKGGSITIAQGGRVIDENGNSLPINYLIYLPEVSSLGTVASDKPFYLEGETVTLTISPAAGCRLKPGTLFYDGTALTVGADGTTNFAMPANPVTVKATFEEALRIESASDTVIGGQSIELSAFFPPYVDTQGAVYEWTMGSGSGLGTLTGQNTPTATLQTSDVADDVDIQIIVTVKIGDVTMTANKTILIKGKKVISINQNPTTPFRPGETLQLTASLNQNPAPAGSLRWVSRIQSVADVDANGLVTFKGVGTTMITASSVEDMKNSGSISLAVVLDVKGNLKFKASGNAAYRAIDIKKNGKPLQTVHTDMNGNFSLKGIGAGTYQLFSEPNMPGYDVLSKTIVISEGSSNSVWSLEYPKCDTGSISFSFKDTDGVPIPGVRVALGCEQPYQAMVEYSGDDGVGRFDKLSYAAEGTTFHLNYSTNDGAFDNKDVVLKVGESSSEVSFVLPHTSTVTGRVVDTNGTGISGLYIQVGSRSAYTNDTGTYSVRGKMQPGNYPVQIGEWEKFFPVGEDPIAAVTDGGNISIPDIEVTMGIGVSGKVLLDGRTDNYKKAYVSLTDASGAVIASGYASGDGGFGMDGAIKKPGTYRMSVGQIYDPTGWYAIEYEAESVTFVVSDMSQERVALDLPARTKLKTSEVFRGEGNTLTSGTQLAQAGGKVELRAKYKNHSNQTVTATFETKLINSHLDPSYIGSEYAKTTHIVTLKAGQSGSFIIKTLVDKGKIPMFAAETTVTLNGETYDFGRISVDVANVTLSAQSASVGIGQSFVVYGEAAKNSIVTVHGPGDELLGAINIGSDSGRWYAMELKGFDKKGTYEIYATADMGSEIAISDKIRIDVSESPVKLRKVSVDQLNYDDLPINARVGIRAFSHTVDSLLVPDPLTLRSLFDGDDRISAVVYHFAENNYTAKKDSNGYWYADLDGWRGTGTKQLTATVTADGRQMELTVAEVTVLVDPSGHITDADTGNPIAGANVSCYVRQQGDSYSLWDNNPHGQPANPWTTGPSGYYGWNVPDGIYRINVEKDGYESAESTQIEEHKNGIAIPPPTLDVNFALVPTIPMQLVGMTSENGEIIARFSRYVSGADITIRNENGETIPCTALSKENSFIITASGLVNGATYTVELRSIVPKSGSSNSYGLELASGTVVFAARRASGSSGSGGSGGSGSGSISERRLNAGFFSSLKIGAADIRKAQRIDGNAVLYLSGKNPKTSGKQLAKALEALKTGEKLALRRMDKNQMTYQIALDPKTLTTLPDTVGFGVTADHRWTRELFEKHFTNKIVAISCTHSGAFGFDAELTVKADVSGLNPKTLIAYTYDRKTNIYEPLKTAAPYIDKDGYLHLLLQSGGTIVLTDAPLVVRQN